MCFNKKYKLTVEDEASLEKKVEITARFPLLIISLGAIIVLSCIIGMLIMAYSPLKSSLPGYLKESERTATEEQHLRLDSLVKLYEINQAYLSSVLNALNPPENHYEKEIDTISRSPMPLKLDSLQPLSDEEKMFMENIRERDKYNIPYTSSAAAQNILFSSINPSAIITDESKEKYQVEIIVPEGSPISTIADGIVISIASSARYSGAFEVIIQHPKGFLSKTSRLTNLTVRPGDHVGSGQIIATGTSKNGMKGNRIFFELWHDGDALMPAHYIKKDTKPV